MFGILRTRGTRGGKRISGFAERCIGVINRRELRAESTIYSKDRRHVNFNNLTQINISPEAKAVSAEQRLKFCLWNAQSIRNKTACFADERKIDLAALTETWLTDRDSAVKVECLPNGYNIFDHPRTRHKGGGTALACRSNITVKRVSACDRSSFEVSEWNLQNDRSSRLRLSIIYRPPNSTNHPVTVNTFIAEFVGDWGTLMLCNQRVY